MKYRANKTCLNKRSLFETSWGILPVCLELPLAGKNDDGWSLLGKLGLKYTDAFYQSYIVNQKRVFLQKERKFLLAVQYSVWNICKRIECDYLNIKDSEDLTDQLANSDSGYSLEEESDEKAKIFGKTKKGNPITDEAYLMFKERIEYLQSVDGLIKSLKGDIKKAKLSAVEKDLCQALSNYLISAKRYQFSKVRDIINMILIVPKDSE